MHAVEPPKQSLSAALRAVREDERDWGASAAVEARLRLAVQARGAERRRARRTFLAAAAVLAVAITAPLWRLAQIPPAQRASEPREEVTTAFFPLVYGSAPDATGQIVRLEVPRTALTRFGLDPGMGTAGKPTVLADVIVGDDGLARAVRFVQPIRRGSSEGT
jgi:hypothetical protein